MELELQVGHRRPSVLGRSELFPCLSRWARRALERVGPESEPVDPGFRNRQQRFRRVGLNRREIGRLVGKAILGRPESGWVECRNHGADKRLFVIREGGYFVLHAI